MNKNVVLTVLLIFGRRCDGIIHQREDWNKAVKEVSRVLKSGGKFFFEEPFRPLLWNMLTRIYAPYPR